jgi:hypothetical protein
MGEKTIAHRYTFHDTCLINSELDANVADLDMSLVGEGDAAKEQVELSCRA